jgi:predicted AlkP superfamily phosphohydrolase/phosphomutase
VNFLGKGDLFLNKILVIGLDGATWALLQEWIDENQLPHLARLQREGISAVLRSTIPPITSAAWAAFATGKEPSNTGVFDFYYREKGTYKVRATTRVEVDGVSLWGRLSQLGKRSILVNVPMTFPAERELNGLMITGIPTPDILSEGSTCPANLFETFHFDKSRYRITLRLPEYADRYADLIDDLKRMEAERLHVAKTLIQEPWDLFIVHFFGTDVVQHALWKFIDPNHPQYQIENGPTFRQHVIDFFVGIDRAIGELLQKIDVDHTTIFVLSDHGFGPNHFSVHINQWLKEIGMLKLHPELITLGQEVSRILIARAGLSKEGLPARILHGLASIPGNVLPSTWQNLLTRVARKRLSGFPRWSALLSQRGYEAVFKAVDWEKTLAYSIGTSGLIYINLKGREPRGSVSPGKEYEKVRDSLANALLSLRSDCGKALVDRVYRKEEIYHGKLLASAPDLIPICESVGCYFYPFLDREKIVTEAESFRSGNHRLDGILMAKGPAVRKHDRLCWARLIDVAPTILYLLGLVISSDMDGTVMSQILEPEYTEKHAIAVAESSGVVQELQQITPEDQKQMAEKLKDLGYL